MATLKTLLSVCFISLLLQTSSSSSVDTPERSSRNQCSHSQVLILGAGMAGISAGHSLAQQGISDFKIIEYRDRIGGRTLHTKFGKRSDGSAYTIELGTNWITGLHAAKGTLSDRVVANPIWTLAQEVNLTTVPDGVKQLCYDQNGRSDWCRLHGEFAIAEARMTEHANDRVKHGKDDISVTAGLRLNGWDSTNNLHKQAVEWLVWDWDGAAPADLSSMIFGILSVDASIGPGERFVLDHRGYDVVTRHLASKYLDSPDSRLVLSSPISSVVYSNESVIVHTANDTCYSADYAICTFSLGVLQQAISGNAPVTFLPVFPTWKKESIATNVMGIYTKIFYQFDRVFWPHDVQYFAYASPTTRGYWTLWESLDFPGSPLEGSGIFFATMVYEQSKRIEQQSDDETMREGLKVLHQMFPNTTIPEPLAFLYPRWGMTEWAYGSYSNWAAGYSLDQFVNFRSNLGRLWFAGELPSSVNPLGENLSSRHSRIVDIVLTRSKGEATSAEYWGYLHGAYYEGAFAAKEVARCVKGLDTCSDRERYTDLHGDPERKYNHASGFRNDIDDLVDGS